MAPLRKNSLEYTSPLLKRADGLTKGSLAGLIVGVVALTALVLTLLYLYPYLRRWILVTRSSNIGAQGCCYGESLEPRFTLPRVFHEKLLKAPAEDANKKSAKPADSPYTQQTAQSPDPLVEQVVEHVDAVVEQLSLSLPDTAHSRIDLRTVSQTEFITESMLLTRILERIVVADARIQSIQRLQSRQKMITVNEAPFAGLRMPQELRWIVSEIQETARQHALIRWMSNTIPTQSSSAISEWTQQTLSRFSPDTTS